MDLLNKKDKLKKSLTIYPIVETNLLNLRLEDFLKDIFSAGVKIIQLREKLNNEEGRKKVAYKIKDFITKFNYEVIYIIDDDPALAKQVGADGVHLGINDIHPKKVREEYNDLIIGYSCNTFDDIEIANLYADYIGIGPYKATLTKSDHRKTLSAKGIKEILDKTVLPAVAIGGISYEEIDNLYDKLEGSQNKLDGIAIASAILSSKEPFKEVKRLRERIDKKLTFKE